MLDTKSNFGICHTDTSHTNLGSGENRPAIV